MRKGKEARRNGPIGQKIRGCWKCRLDFVFSYKIILENKYVAIKICDAGFGKVWACLGRKRQEKEGLGMFGHVWEGFGL